MDFKVSAKRPDGKWFNFGRIKEGKYGPQLSFKNTPELKEHILQGGEWLNFSMFPADDKSKPAPKELPPDTQAMLDALKQSALDEESIPF
jgi:hypothetical protein